MSGTNPPSTSGLPSNPMGLEKLVWHKLSILLGLAVKSDVKSSRHKNRSSQYGFSFCPMEVLFMTAQIGPSISLSRQIRWGNSRETLELAPSNPRLQPSSMGRRSPTHGVCQQKHPEVSHTQVQSHPRGLSYRCKLPQRSLRQALLQDHRAQPQRRSGRQHAQDEIRNDC